MPDLVFRKLNIGDIEQINEFKDEFIKSGSSMDGTGALINSSAADWLESVKEAEKRDNPSGVPCLQYGLFYDEMLLGLIQVRLVLKGYLVDFGGHIGYCVRPSKRRKGYAKLMLLKALDVCSSEGLDRVMITCLEDNTASARTIEACGGVFEKTVYDNLNYSANMKRYWIWVRNEKC